MTRRKRRRYYRTKLPPNELTEVEKPEQAMLHHSIPLIGQKSGTFVLPHPLTVENINFIRGWLDIMEEALTTPETTDDD